MSNHTNFFANKTLLVVNVGSPKKKFVLQRLKKLGLTVVALDKEKNWASSSVDHWINADTYNHTEAIEAVRLFLNTHPKITIDGALTYWEDDIPLLAKLCTEFKWAGNTIEAANNTRNKFQMQEILRQCGEPFIRQHLLKSKEDLEEAIKQIKFPAVLKPVLAVTTNL
jgi:biotin carboxylase